MTETGTAVPTNTITPMDVATPLPALTATQSVEITSSSSAALVWNGKEWQVIENWFTPSVAQVAASPSGKVFGITGDGILLLLTSEGIQLWPGEN